MQELWERNGFRYKITTLEQEGRFVGRWFCFQCERSGGSDHAYASEAEAFGVARADAFVEHHLSVHLLHRKQPQPGEGDS